MTIKEIYEQILIDVPKLDMRNFLKRYNAVVGILATMYDTANVPKTDYIDATDSEQAWYPLPIDCKGVNRVTTEKGSELRTYLCEKGQINFGCSGNFAIEYIGTPTKLTKFEDKPISTGINDSYHIAIVEYILAYEQPTNFQTHMDMYKDLSEKADIRLKGMKRKNMRIAAPRWR